MLCKVIHGAGWQHTLTGRYTSRPHSCSLTCASVVSHQSVACITTVGGCLSKCCSSSVTNLAIGWVSQIATVHNCQKQIYDTYAYTYTYQRVGRLSIRESVDSLCRDGADAQYMQYLSKSRITSPQLR